MRFHGGQDEAMDEDMDESVDEDMDEAMGEDMDESLDEDMDEAMDEEMDKMRGAFHMWRRRCGFISMAFQVATAARARRHFASWKLNYYKMEMQNCRCGR